MLTGYSRVENYDHFHAISFLQEIPRISRAAPFLQGRQCSSGSRHRPTHGPGSECKDRAVCQRFVRRSTHNARDAAT